MLRKSELRRVTIFPAKVYSAADIFALGYSMRLLVADIGGTNGRFALASVDDDSGQISLSQVRSFLNSEFSDLKALLGRYLSSLEGEVPGAACMAVAGPNDGRSGFMVNLDWEIDAGELEKNLPLGRIQFVNDFAALAAAVPRLAAEDLLSLHAAPAGPGCISVIGPGTGLGVAALAPGSPPQVLATEGGHMSWAPADARERELADYLRSSVEYLCVETVLSGLGLVRIYEFLCSGVGGSAVHRSPADITELAVQGSDARCVEAVQIFLAVLGGVSGDIVLAQGATGGVYFGGGILPRIAPLVAGSELLSRLQARGPLTRYMENIPVHLITADNPALTGAAALFCYS
jgi:glucokinase